jgi:hypothetical protein
VQPVNPNIADLDDKRGECMNTFGVKYAKMK